MMHGEGLKREDDLLDGVAFQGVAKFLPATRSALNQQWSLSSSARSGSWPKPW